MFERIQKIMDHERLNSKEFAEEVGINPSSLSHYFSGKRTPNLDVINRILTRFNHIDAEWLLQGKGNMFKNDPEQPIIQQPKIDKRQLQLFDDMDKNANYTKPKESVPEQNITSEKIEENINLHASAEIRIPTNKRIIKLVIFYSDNTFDTFIPDVNKEFF